VQSNNCRQTAAACAKAGLACHLVLTRGKDAQGAVAVQGNLLLDHLVGASYEIVEAAMGDELDGLIAARAADFRERGCVPYFWDRAVVTPLAAVSYVLCMTEIAEQSRALEIEPQAVYVSSAGSTGAGLALGAAALGTGIPVRNICPIEWEWDTRADMADTANRAAELIGIPKQLAAKDVDVTFDYIAPGYGKASPGCEEAIALLARTEGILLDPIYSGKAMAALIEHIRRGELDRSRPVVFVHTGGTPALFAYAEELANGIERRSLR
jgi:1-aminocyclopropane-1-carboxylate deaminase/D-cysteine desulfhydrase-like pyridoxal-dependent ACC family enzyme